MPTGILNRAHFPGDQHGPCSAPTFSAVRLTSRTEPLSPRLHVRIRAQGAAAPSFPAVVGCIMPGFSEGRTSSGLSRTRGPLRSPFLVLQKQLSRLPTN